MRLRTLAFVGALAALVGWARTRARRPAEVPPEVSDFSQTPPSDLPAAPPTAEPPEDLPTGWSVVEVDERTGRPRDDDVLRGVSAIRRFFRTNSTPVWFVSATAFNLLGIDRWVRGFGFLNYYDSFDGHHPRVFVPKQLAPPTFGSIEEICNYLLSHKEVVDRVRPRGGKALFLMFDEETERLAAEAGLEVAFPPAELRHRLDSKIETTRARGRRRSAERAERPRPRLELRRAANARRRGRAREPISWCRPRMATPGRRRSSWSRRASGPITRSSSSARS